MPLSERKQQNRLGLTKRFETASSGVKTPISSNPIKPRTKKEGSCQLFSPHRTEIKDPLQGVLTLSMGYQMKAPKTGAKERFLWHFELLFAQKKSDLKGHTEHFCFLKLKCRSW